VRGPGMSGSITRAEEGPTRHYGVQNQTVIWERNPAAGCNGTERFEGEVDQNRDVDTNELDSPREIKKQTAEKITGHQIKTDRGGGRRNHEVREWALSRITARGEGTYMSPEFADKARKERKRRKSNPGRSAGEEDQHP